MWGVSLSNTAAKRQHGRCRKSKGFGHFLYEFRQRVSEIGNIHFVSMVPARDTFGQSPAFLEKYWMERLAAEGGLRNAELDSVLVLRPIPMQ